MMRCALLLCVLFLPATAYAAMPMPAYPVEDYCHKMARMPGRPSGTLFNDCLASEQHTRDQVAAHWSDTPQHAQIYCDRLARSAGFGRYARLRSCLAQQAGARRRRPR